MDKRSGENSHLELKVKVTSKEFLMIEEPQILLNQTFLVLNRSRLAENGNCGIEGKTFSFVSDPACLVCISLSRSIVSYTQSFSRPTTPLVSSSETFLKRGKIFYQLQNQSLASASEVTPFLCSSWSRYRNSEDSMGRVLHSVSTSIRFCRDYLTASRLNIQSYCFY